ncbi:TetR/AcrR family transcriptional regulator [Actinotalea sp. C106]|uniref:TetR/AcrR family transcriptional regulator n=1 Tax=Actinotalea sp. C106 TaxID=2908644 RepID=UPI0020287F76|nr:TetR/AcrR family transcriptional regulator [Actinotalea sp. C106]
MSAPALLDALPASADGAPDGRSSDAPEVDLPAPDGRSARWDEHRTQRRAELVHAARKAVHRHGPDVSMEEIAATAGTSKSIVYRYFQDKPGLQVAVGAAVVAQMHTALDEASRAAETPREGLRAMIDVYLAMVEHSPHVYYFVTRPLSEDAEAPLGHFLDAVATLIARPFTEVLTAGSRERVQADLWASGAVGFIRGTGEWWLSHREDDGAPTRLELTDRVTTWLLAGPVGFLTRTRPEPSSTTEPSTTTEPPRTAHTAHLNDEEQS